MTKLLQAPGDTLTEGFGPDLATPTLLVTMTLHVAGIAFHITDGVQRVAELCKTYTDRSQAAAFYRHVRDAAMQGKRIHQIVWEIAALDEAQNAATARSEDDLAGAINAEWDARQAETVETHNKLVADVQTITADGQGWNRARKQARQSTAAPATDAMAQIIAQAANTGGRIVRGGQPGQASSTQLVRLAERGLVELTYRWRGNQRVITGATLVRNPSEVAA